MGAIKLALIAIVVAGVAYKIGEHILYVPPFPALDPNPWWGSGEPRQDDTSIKSHKINIPEKDVKDLQMRLGLPLRLTTPLENVNFNYGMNHNTLQKIITYWQKSYDWKQREQRLNKYPHFRTQIEGLDIHFMRASAQVGKSSNVKVVPLLLIHGWPGSFVEFFNILPLLTTPQEGSSVVFDVICPSIPGYGFSQTSSKPGLGHLETSQIFLKLMKRLGFEKFYVQGGDWGSLIASDMATMYPKNVLGVHINGIVVNTPGSNMKYMLGALLPAGTIVSKEDQDKVYPVGEKFSYIMQESGYLHIQATKPDTVGAALNQSPVGLAAYILEKFSGWTHKDYINLPDGGLLQKDFPISLDEMLDNICVYWFTGTITSSMRFYAEFFSNRYFVSNVDGIPCVVPAGLAAFPHDLLNDPENFAAHKYHDIVSYTDQTKGGHFAAMERPTLLAVDVHKFVTAVEKRK